MSTSDRRRGHPLDVVSSARFEARVRSLLPEILMLEDAVEPLLTARHALLEQTDDLEDRIRALTATSPADDGYQASAR